MNTLSRRQVMGSAIGALVVLPAVSLGAVKINKKHELTELKIDVKEKVVTVTGSPKYINEFFDLNEKNY